LVAEVEEQGAGGWVNLGVASKEDGGIDSRRDVNFLVEDFVET
jgi:hypothetical protein